MEEMHDTKRIRREQRAAIGRRTAQSSAGLCMRDSRKLFWFHIAKQNCMRVNGRSQDTSFARNNCLQIEEPKMLSSQSEGVVGSQPDLSIIFSCSIFVSSSKVH